MNRRQFLATTFAGTLACGGLSHAAFAPAPPRRRAEACIFIWLGGGLSQLDSFDPKPQGDPATRTAGALYPSRETAVPGVRLAEPLRQLAPLMERLTAVRSLHHGFAQEHAPAARHLHAERSALAERFLPPAGPGEPPPYVCLGLPFGPRPSGCLLPHTRPLLAGGPALLPMPFLASLRPGPPSTSSSRLFPQNLTLPAEKGSEFARRCLLARRLVESGTRFVEITFPTPPGSTGWDVHHAGLRGQHALLSDLDQSLARLIRDLEARHQLDRTLIVVATEFGRSAAFDEGGGRGHQSSAFTCLLAGGGLRHQGACGVTDELSRQIVADPVTVPDFFATLRTALGLVPPMSGLPLAPLLA